MTIIDISNHDLHEIIDHNLVLLAFSATWCEPCKRMRSVLEKINSVMSETVQIVEIDIYENQEIAKKFDIIGTPTLILLKDGKVLEKIVGYQPQDVITDFIRKYV